MYKLTSTVLMLILTAGSTQSHSPITEQSYTISVQKELCITLWVQSSTDAHTADLCCDIAPSCATSTYMGALRTCEYRWLNSSDTLTQSFATLCTAPAVKMNMCFTAWGQTNFDWRMHNRSVTKFFTNTMYLVKPIGGPDGGNFMFSIL